MTDMTFDSYLQRLRKAQVTFDDVARTAWERAREIDALRVCVKTADCERAEMGVAALMMRDERDRARLALAMARECGYTIEGGEPPCGKCIRCLHEALARVRRETLEEACGVVCTACGTVGQSPTLSELGCLHADGTVCEAESLHCMIAAMDERPIGSAASGSSRTADADSV